MHLSKHLHFAGFDPGHKGGIGVMNAAGTRCKVWKMPDLGDGNIDMAGLRDICRYLKHLPDVVVGIEWPTAWPGAFNNVITDAENFGRQKGVLEAFCYLHGLESHRVSPTTWKGKLALDGKTVVGANARAAALFDAHYPAEGHLIRGPRGGLLDGPLDALLIAHFLRVISGSVAANTVRGSAEHMAAILSMGPGKRRLCRMPKKP